MIPEFPQSRKITIEDKPLFDSLFASCPPELSTYTFTNIFAWRDASHTELSRLDDHILLTRGEGDHLTCLQPLGHGNARTVIEAAFAASDRLGSFERISAAVAAEMEGSSFAVEADRDNYDYLYSIDDLVNLDGRKYDGKRNQIARAKSAVPWEYIKLDGRTAMECEEFAQEWCEDRQCQTVDGLRQESCAVYQMLSHFDELGITGGAIRSDGKIVAFTLAEALNPETLVIHVEKADTRIEGLYQLINNEFCKAEAAQFKFVNREQDLGVPGLRKAKESYHPIRMVETFRISKP